MKQTGQLLFFPARDRGQRRQGLAAEHSISDLPRGRQRLSQYLSLFLPAQDRNQRRQRTAAAPVFSDLTRGRQRLSQYLSLLIPAPPSP